MVNTYESINIVIHKYGQYKISSLCATHTQDQRINCYKKAHCKHSQHTTASLFPIHNKHTVEALLSISPSHGEPNCSIIQYPVPEMNTLSENESQPKYERPANVASWKHKGVCVTEWVISACTFDVLQSSQTRPFVWRMSWRKT